MTAANPLVCACMDRNGFTGVFFFLLAGMCVAMCRLCAVGWAMITSPKVVSFQTD